MSKTLIIAEAGVNHNGSMDLAKQLIDVAADAGADAVKFQTFNAKQITSLKAQKAEYQKKTTSVDESQYDMLKKLELDRFDHISLIKYCETKKIKFLSTPFDLESIDLLSELNLPLFKIASGEIDNAPLLLKASQSGKPIILSTGMSTLSDVEFALSVIALGYQNNNISQPTVECMQAAYLSDEGQKKLKQNVTLLHCTTEYPAAFSEVNLNAMLTLHKAFGLSVGYSDHTPGIEIPIAAVALGATVIEKHFTVSKNFPGPDHKASLEPDELIAMIKGIRHVEQSLGDGIKKPRSSELKNKMLARKSIIALCHIQKGEIFTEKNLGLKRPGTGISGIFYWDWLGKYAERNYSEDELIV